MNGHTSKSTPDPPAFSPGKKGGIYLSHPSAPKTRNAAGEEEEDETELTENALGGQRRHRSARMGESDQELPPQIIKLGVSVAVSIGDEVGTGGGVPKTATDLFLITMEPPWGRERGGFTRQTDIERLDLAIPHDEVAHVGQGAADEDMIVDGDGLGPHGPALLGGFLGVVFQRDGRRFGILDGRVRFIASMRPVGGDQGRGWLGRFFYFFLWLVAVVGAVMILNGIAQLAVCQSTIDPSTITDATKDQWCTDQKSACPLICLQLPGTSNQPKSNTCDSTSLAYSCICSNGQQPNSSQYSQTIPYFECTQAATNCVSKCEQTDTSCQSACRSDNPCGAQNPVRVNTSTISTMAATTTASKAGSSTAGTSATNTFTGFGGSSTASSKSVASARIQTLALGLGGEYGLLIVLGGMMGGFMFML
ncbi:MAG: hypothetical protein Q9161_000188 [Pseudevernia consocians]